MLAPAPDIFCHTLQSPNAGLSREATSLGRYSLSTLYLLRPLHFHQRRSFGQAASFSRYSLSTLSSPPLFSLGSAAATFAPSLRRRSGSPSLPIAHLLFFGSQPRLLLLTALQNFHLRHLIVLLEANKATPAALGGTRPLGKQRLLIFR